MVEDGSAARSGPGVLVVDDDPRVVQALAQGLRRHHFEVIGASAVAEAQKALAAREVRAVIADLRLGREDGIELLGWIADRFPQTVRILLTGHGDYAASRRAINEGRVFAFLEKPWSAADVVQTINAGMVAVETARARDDLVGVQHGAGEAPGLSPELTGLVEGVATLETSVKRGHGRRVAEVMSAFCDHLGLRPTLVAEARVAALLHDIGEAVLPDGVQPIPQTQLSATQMTAFQRHPAVGEAVLASCPALRASGRLVRHHHERYDGRGFPDGLAGESIPVGARLLSVVDAYDEAINGHLLPKKCAPREARSFLLDERGKRFDPRAVNIFIRWMDQNAAEGDSDEGGVPVDQLRVGMVLSRDLTTESGMLLIPAGHRISESLLARINALAGHRAGRLRAHVSSTPAHARG